MWFPELSLTNPAVSSEVQLMQYRLEEMYNMLIPGQEIIGLLSNDSLVVEYAKYLLRRRNFIMRWLDRLALKYHFRMLFLKRPEEVLIAEVQRSWSK